MAEEGGIRKEHLVSRLRELENIKFKVEGAIEIVITLLKELEIQNGEKTVKPKARKKSTN